MGAPRHWFTEVAEVDGSMAVMVSSESTRELRDASALLSASGGIEGWFPLQDCSGLGL